VIGFSRFVVTTKKLMDGNTICYPPLPSLSPPGPRRYFTMKQLLFSILIFVTSASHSPHSLSAQQKQAIPDLSKFPPGSTTQVLPDGNIAVISPFSPEQKRQINERNAKWKAIRKARTLELKKQAKNNSLYPRLPGEFEKQKAILLSACDWQPHLFHVLVDLINKSKGHAQLVIVYNEKSTYDDGKPQLNELIKAMLKSGQDFPHVRFLNLNLDTIWLRDFGPRIAETAETENGSSMVVNFFHDAARPFDDDFPELWAKLTGAVHNHVPWLLQGGNLISNGKGLAIATTGLFEKNRITIPGKDYLEVETHVRQQVMQACNIKELVMLKPLENENTRHVDMFASFLAPDLAVIAKLDPRYDAQNAKILDDNAKKLSQVRIDGKPLRVERIWIPPRRGDSWSSYANIILSDRLVMVPILDSDPQQYVQHAVQTYRRLLPTHQVTTIDMTTMQKLGGSLHCLTCPVPEFAKLPEGLLSFKESLTRSGLK